MKHGSLFSGIGGFDLAAEWMGWENVFHCEWNEFGQKILKHYWPKAISYGDITKTDFTVHRGAIDILTGGFPCQPYSQAGKRKGTADDRHLWPEMLRAIREIQPSWIVGENVRGLTNWNGGLVFDQVQAEMEAEGYEVLPFLLPACAVNAPHRRDRIWFIAHSERSCGKRELQQQSKQGQFGGCNIANDVTIPSGERCHNGGDNRKERHIQGNEGASKKNKSEWEGRECGVSEISKTITNTITNTDSRRQPSEEHREEEPRRITEKSLSSNWQNFPTQSPVCSGDDGIPRELDGITFPKWRNESIKGFGNAVVPVLVYEIFKAIEKFNQTT